MKSKSKKEIKIIDRIALIYIDYSKLSMKLTILFNKINKMPLFSNLEENQEICFEKSDNKNSTIIDPNDINIESPSGSFFENEIKNSNGIFNEKNGDLLLENFSNVLHDEIHNVYLTYLKVEKNIFKKLNSLLNHSEKFPYFNLLQLVTKLKEINQLSNDTFKLTYYIEINLKLLKKICNELDLKISKLYDKGFLSYQILRNQFELPDTPLSYILKFKIIDESCFIIDDLRKKLLNYINICDRTNITKINNESNLSKNLLSDEDRSIMNSLDQQLNDERVAKKTINKLLSKSNHYNLEIIKNLKLIFLLSKIRLKYYNLSVFIRYEYSQSNIQNENDKVFINSLMDEENVIHYFIDKSVYKEYINKKKNKLSKGNRSNINLILIKFFIYQIIFCTSLFYKKDDENNKNNSLYIGIIFIGIFLSKIFTNILLKEGKNHFSIIILSQIFIIIGLIIPMFSFTQEKTFILISRFFIGFSSTFSLNGNYLMTYVPRSLLKFYLKKYNFLKIPSNILGFLISYILFDLNQKRIFGLNNFSDLIFLFISLILLLIFVIIFIPTSSLNFSTINDDTTTILFENDAASYGQKKNITLSDKKNIDKININLNKESELGNYVETNKINNYIDSVILQSNKFFSFNHSNFISICFILISQYVNYMIIFFFGYYHILNDNTDKKSLCLIFAFSYLSYFIFHFLKKLFKCIKQFSHKKRFVLTLLQIFQIFFIFLYLMGIDLIKEYFKLNYLYNILSFIIIINCLVIENKSLKLLSRLIPKTFKLCGLSIYFYLDFLENFSKLFCCLIIYYEKNDFVFSKYISYLILCINLLTFFIFLLCFKNLKTNPLNKMVLRKYKLEIGVD